MNNVYLVELSEQYEGSYLVGIYKDEDKAYDEAFKIANEHDKVIKSDSYCDDILHFWEVDDIRYVEVRVVEVQG